MYILSQIDDDDDSFDHILDIYVIVFPTLIWPLWHGSEQTDVTILAGQSGISSVPFRQLPI